MKEELFVSGRMNHMIDPHLHIWHWQIPFIFSWEVWLQESLLLQLSILSEEGKKITGQLSGLPLFWHLYLLVLGLFALFIDLSHKLFFWQLYTNIKLAITNVVGCLDTDGYYSCFIYLVCSSYQGYFPEWDWKYQMAYMTLETFFNKYKKALAWVMLIYAIILGIYTGILFSF